MDSSIVGYIILGLIGFIMLMSLLFGLKRGVKKTTFRFVWLVVSGAILWILTPAISTWLNSFDISSLNLNINGPVSKLSDIGVNLLDSLNLDEAISQSEAVRTFAENFPTMILNVVVFVLGFWVLKILLYPIWAIIASKCFDKKKRELKAYKRKIKNLKKRGVPVDEDDMPDNLAIGGKNRFGGMLVGILTGFIICVATLCPLIGLNTIYQKANANLVTQNEEGEEVPYLPTVIDEGTQEYLNSYQNSIAFKVANYTGINYFSNLAFEKLASVEVGGEKIYLANEVDNGIYLYNKYTAISNFMENKDTCTQESIADALSNIKDILLGLKGSKLIDTLGDDLLPYFVDKFFAENEDLKIEIDGQDYAELLKTAYKNSTAEEKLKVDQFIDQVEALIDIATLFNENGLMEPIIKGEVSTTSEMIGILVKNNVNAKDFSKDFVDNLFKVTLFSGEYPTLVDSAVEKVFTGAGIEGYEKKGITSDSLKQNLKDILENLISYLKLENEKTDGYFKEENNACDSYGSLGKVIDVAKSGLLSESSYNGLIKYLKSKANEMLGGTEDKESKYSAILNSIDDITSWETEFRSVAPLINTVMQVKNEETDFSFDKILSSDYEAKAENDPTELIGNTLQKAINNKSVFITNYNIKETFKSLLTDMEISYLDITVDTKSDETKVSLKEYMLNQIWTGEKTSGVSKIKNWGNEFKYSLNVLRKALGTLSNFDKESLSSSKSFEELGKAIDEAMETVNGEKNTHLFVENNVLRALIENFLDENLLSPAEPSDENKTEIDKIMAVVVNNVTGLTVKNSILNNIYHNGTTKVESWETELGYLKKLFVADFTDLVAMGEVLDDISKGNIFSRTEIKAVVCYYIDEQSASFTDSDTEKIVLISKVKDNVDNVQSYKTEIQNLMNLMAVVNKTDWTADSDNSLTADQVKFKTIGRQFDLLSGKKDKTSDETTTTTVSNLLTTDVLNEFLKYFVKDSVSSLEDSDELKYIVAGGPYNSTDYAGLCANVDSIASYGTEFLSMEKLVNITTGTSQNLSEIGKTIDAIKGESKLVPSILNDVVAYYVNKNVPDGYRDARNLIISKLKPTGGSTPLSITSYTKEFGYMAELESLVEGTINLVRPTSDTSTDTIYAGELFNKVVFGKVGETATESYKSELLTQEVVNEILKVVITNQLSKNSDINNKLKEKLSGITDNVSTIADYEMEFGHMEKLLDAMKGSNVSLSKLGTELDSTANAKSQLFNSTIIRNVLEYFFDDQMESYLKDSSEYKTVAGSIRSKALEVVNQTGTNKYESMLNEVNSLKTNLDNLQNVKTYDEFKNNATNVGGYLDNIEAMTWVADKTIAKDIATIAFNKMKEVAETKLPASSDSGDTDGAKGGSARIEKILNGDKFRFDNHATDNTPKGTVDGDNVTNYYSLIMADIKIALEAIDSASSNSSGT